MPVFNLRTFTLLLTLFAGAAANAQQLITDGKPAQLAVRQAGENSIRITLKPLSYKPDYPSTPALLDRKYKSPDILITSLPHTLKKQVGKMLVEVKNSPLTITVNNLAGKQLQKLVFNTDNTVTFALSGQPVLGLGEGGHKTPRGRGLEKTGN